MRLHPSKERHFPRIHAEGYVVTSVSTPEYNCIAFAADDEEHWWWPDDSGTGFWPIGFPREETLDAFIEAYGLLGYDRCDDGEVEDGYEKIAIYAEKGVPTHAAKQLNDGRWKSKLGRWEDIQNTTLDGLYDSAYGEVAIFMRRKKP